MAAWCVHVEHGRIRSRGDQRGVNLVAFHRGSSLGAARGSSIAGQVASGLWLRWNRTGEGRDVGERRGRETPEFDFKIFSNFVQKHEKLPT
jgi:hypothetical protein